LEYQNQVVAVFTEQFGEKDKRTVAAKQTLNTISNTKPEELKSAKSGTN
jgi:hypothetical protein